jgi:hypothetical protein
LGGFDRIIAVDHRRAAPAIHRLVYVRRGRSGTAKRCSLQTSAS